MKSEKITEITELKRKRYLPGPEIINMYKITGTLTTDTPLHVGSGIMGKAPDRGPDEENGENCALIEKDFRDRPCIPGSSLRGVVRSWLETNLMPFNPPGEYSVAALSVAEFESQKGITNDEIETRKNDLRKEAHAQGMDAARAEKHVMHGMTRFYLDRLDLVSGLFGFSRFKGKVEVDSAYVKNADAWRDCNIFTMPGVAIDRETGTAKEHSLFTYELVAPKVTFSVHLTLRNVRLWEIGMVLAAFENFNHPLFPLRIGGLTNLGFGQLSWKPDTIYQIGHDESTQAAAKVQEDLIAFFASVGSGDWEPLSIAKRGFTNTEDFKAHCFAALSAVLDSLTDAAKDTGKEGGQ